MDIEPKYFWGFGCIGQEARRYCTTLEKSWDPIFYYPLAAKSKCFSVGQGGGSIVGRVAAVEEYVFGACCSCHTQYYAGSIKRTK